MNSKTPMLLSGLPVSKGIAIGRSYLIEHGKNIVKEIYIKKDQTSREIKKLNKSVDLTINVRRLQVEGFEIPDAIKVIETL